MTIETIVFDLGGVLIDWNPRYVYRQLFDDEAKMEYFLEHITTSDWNEEQDAGRPLAEATELLVKQHPEWEEMIRAYYGRWEEMLGGVIEGTRNILKQIKESKKYRLYALTNWSAETFPVALERYDFLQWFEDILVSGEEKMRKPQPEFYQLMLDRFKVNPATTIFIDDNLRNAEAARAMGIYTIHFQSPAQLKKELTEISIHI
ncbi:MAG: HAD family phosphatase [Bacteroidota bacterium]